MKFEAVTIVTAATDEDFALRETVDTIMSECSREDISRIIIVRSKNASEACRNAIKAMENKYQDVVIGFEQNLPHLGGAIREGFDKVDTSHVILVPADMAISLDCVPEMIERAKKNPDVISKASRWLKSDSFHGYNGFRKILNRTAQVFLKVLYGENLTDFTNPVQIAPTEVYKKANWQELNFPFLVEMVLLPLRLGVKFEEFPVSCYGRQEGKSKNSVTQTAMYLKTALRVRFSSKKKLIKET